MDKKIAASKKEGGKKGQDLSGVAAMGGVMYFNVAVETPEGDMQLLKAVMEGSNVEVDEAAEERKGGAGDLGKFFLSAGEQALIGYAHVPKALSESKGLGVEEWTNALLEGLPTEGRTVDKEGDEYMSFTILANAEAGNFPLKMRDAALANGFKLLRSKGLIVEDESDDDVNYAEAAGVEW